VKGRKPSFFKRFLIVGTSTNTSRLLDRYEALAFRVLRRPGFATAGHSRRAGSRPGSVCFPFLGRAYFPRTDPGQFIIDVRMPSGTRLEVSNDYIAKVENIIRGVVKPKTWA
jgi:multidrug efflux pump subunit AcrB